MPAGLPESRKPSILPKAGKTRVKKRAVFFDRDGTLIEAVLRDGKPASIADPEKLVLLKGAREGIEALHRRQFLIFIVTNQPDVTRGKVSVAQVEAVHQKLLEALGPDKISKIYYCPHDDQDRCECRKPKPGMLLRASKEWEIDLASSFMVGDQERDMAAGRSAGMPAALVDAGYNQAVHPDYRGKDIPDICRWILEREMGISFSSKPL